MGSASDSVVSSSPIKGSSVSLNKKLTLIAYIVLVGSRNPIERDLHKQKLLVLKNRLK